MSSQPTAHELAHRPHTAQHTLRLAHARTYHEPASPDGILLDHATITHRTPDTIRLAAIDPAIAFDPHQAIPGLHTALEVFDTAASPDEALIEANKRLHTPGRTRSDGYARYAAVIADWNPTRGTLTAAQAADCEVWTRDTTTNTWTPLFPEHMLAPTIRKHWETHAPPSHDRHAYMAAHDHILGTPGAWLCAPLGQFPGIHFRTATARNINAVAVCTDGLTATPDTFTGLDAWIEHLHDRPDGWTHPHPHGDLAIAIAWLPDSPPA